MFKRPFLYLVIVSFLLFPGCFISGKVVDQNGAGIAGVKVTLSFWGSLSRTTITNEKGNYIFGDLSKDDIISPGSYTVIPSKYASGFSPASKNVSITTGTLDGYGVVPFPVGGVDFVGDTTKGSCGVVCLPKTGQTTSYAAGDDGDLKQGAGWPEPRFEDNGDGTVTDHLTGLIWLKDANCVGKAMWEDALAFCNNLESGSCGLSDGSKAGDWRLPNIIELESLINAESSIIASWLNSQGFTNAQNSHYWSSTRSGAYGRVVEMYSGSTGGNYISYYQYVWPVRNEQSGSSGDPAILCRPWKTGQTTSYAAGDDGDLKKGVSWPEPRFEDNGDGTVTDHLTGLIWLKDANCAGGTITWHDFVAFCNSLKSGSYSLADGSKAGDWRVPNRKELLSLIDHSRQDPALPQGHPFSNVQVGAYWSSTTNAGLPGQKWYISMSSGGVWWDFDIESPSYYKYGWPVRAGQ